MQIKTSKHDQAAAEAIGEAVRRPQMGALVLRDRLPVYDHRLIWMQPLITLSASIA